MNFTNLIKEKSKNKKCAIFIDMDGVIVEFNPYDDEKIKNNGKGIYLTKKPISYTIKIVKRLKKIKNLDIYILSACHYESQREEKENWIDKNLKIIDKDKRIILVKEKLNLNKKEKRLIKGKIIKNIMEEKSYDKSFYIDDSHELLRGAIEVLNDQTEVFHISSIL